MFRAFDFVGLEIVVGEVKYIVGLILDKIKECRVKLETTCGRNKMWHGTGYQEK